MAIWETLLAVVGPQAAQRQGTRTNMQLAAQLMVQIGAAAFALLAAALWARSSVIKMPASFPIVIGTATMTNQTVGSTLFGTGRSVELNELGKAANEQSRLSAWAARCAALAALCQAAAVFI